LLHPGHVSLLKSAAAECDRLIVAINSDASVRRLKGPARPVQDETSRAYVLGALSAVDLVLVFDEDTPAETIAALKPDLLVKGADYTMEEVVGAETVRAAGGRVLLVPLMRGQSTTSLLRRATDLEESRHPERFQAADG
jgi:D-beta-D-heptose 7-phosphate kinase/D-beta-D-heptose 1-phosphate adenosyltransferase